jgi:hypothetical protein
VRNLLFHGFVSFTHKCHALSKHENRVHDFRVKTIQIDTQHSCLNNAHDIHVQTIQVDE